MVNQQKRIYSTSKAAKDKTRLDATLKVQLEHINIGSDFYSKAGRKFEMKEMLARSKIDRPDLETAYEGVDQFVQQDINTRPTKSKFLDLCAADLIAKGLTEKRSLELVDEALALLKDGKSCIK